MLALRRHAADLVSGMRLAASPLLIWALASRRFILAAIVVMLAIVTDVGDGWLARRLRTATARGRWLDHGADIAFLLAGFATLVWLGEVHAVVPAAIAAAFAFYVFDSLRRSPSRSLIGSRLGHLSGIFNYAILAVVVFDAALRGPLPERLLEAVLAAVPLYSAAAMAARVVADR